MTAAARLTAPIRTKLHRPRHTHALIARTRLFALLEGRQPLTLVVAPAGFGKTTLVSSWLEAQPLPAAWLTLDHHDDDPATFLGYLVAALRVLAPTFGSATLNLPGHVTPPPEVVARALLNDLEVIEAPCLLVLDDYHVITQPAVHAILGALLHHPHPCLQLVLLTRRDPPLPLARLRARSQLAEVRTNDLRFSPAETLAFFQQMLSAPVAPDTAALVEQKTEGWIAGLHLAVAYLRGHPDPEAVARLQDSSRYIMDYLTTEVLSQQPPALQAFVLKTSILDRLCAPLCDAVTGAPDENGAGAQEHLHRLAVQNVFLFALDNHAHWFRYHHLYQQLLQQRLRQSYPPDAVAVLHSRASAWLAAEGETEAAIHHALAAGDPAAAVRLVAQQRHRLMDAEQWHTLRRWLEYFDRSTIEREPELLLAEAWLIVSQGRIEGHAALLQQIDALLETGNTLPLVRQQLRAEADILRCELLYFSLQPQAVVTIADAALPHLPVTWGWARSYLLLFLAGAWQMLGDFAQASAVLNRNLEQVLPYPSVFHVRTLAELALIQWIGADLPALLRTVRTYQPLAAELELRESSGWASYCIGLVYYQWNELARAGAALEPLMQQPYLLTAATFANASCALALVYQAQGRADAATATIASAAHFLAETDQARASQCAAFQAELMLRQANFAGAARWAALHPTPAPLAPLFDAFAPQLTRPKILIAQGSPAALQEASDLLENLRQFLAGIHSTRFLIETLAWLALATYRRGATARALTHLDDALGLAEPGGLVRVFADCGPALLPLLALAAEHSQYPAFAAQIVAAIAAEQPAAPAVASRPAPLPQPAAGIVELLTQREYEVLALLAQRLTNKEIAHALAISSDTVKQHTSNLYGKLMVEDRRQAVERARTLGLLPPA